MFAVAARLSFAKSKNVFKEAKKKRTKNKLELKYNASLPLILKNKDNFKFYMPISIHVIDQQINYQLKGYFPNAYNFV